MKEHDSSPSGIFDYVCAVCQEPESKWLEYAEMMPFRMWTQVGPTTTGQVIISQVIICPTCLQALEWVEGFRAKKVTSTPKYPPVCEC